MSWSFPLLARQVIHAADPPRSNPSWADKELLPGKKTLHDYVTNDVKKKGAAFDVVEMSENTKVPTTSLKKLSQFSFTLSQHFRNEHRPIQHAAQGSQGGSNGLMIYAGMTHLVDSCLEGSEPGL